MVSKTAAGETLLTWGNQIKEPCLCSNELQNEQIKIVNVEENGVKASPEEVALVLKYWSSVYTGNVKVLNEILEDSISAIVTRNGCAQTISKQQILSIVPQMAKKLKGIEQLSLQIFKKLNGQLKVVFSQELVLQEKNITSSGKQKWTIINDNDTLRFAAFRVKEINVEK